MPRRPKGVPAKPRGRPKGSKDTKQRKYNPRSGKNGNGNIYKTPCLCSWLVTYDPVIKFDARYKSTKAQALPEHVNRIAAHLYKHWGLAPSSDAVWEIGTKTGRVHAHWFMHKILWNKNDMSKMYKAIDIPRWKGESSCKYLTNYGKLVNDYKTGTFLTMKMRLFQPGNVPTSSYLDKDEKQWKHNISIIHRKNK